MAGTKPRKMAPRKAKKKVFPRSGFFPISKIGSLNITPEQVIHYLGGCPNGQVKFFVGEEGNTLIIKMPNDMVALLPADTSKKRLAFLQQSDVYSPEEWEAKKKEHHIDD